MSYRHKNAGEPPKRLNPAGGGRVGLIGCPPSLPTLWHPVGMLSSEKCPTTMGLYNALPVRARPPFNPRGGRIFFVYLLDFREEAREGGATLFLFLG